MKKMQKLAALRHFLNFYLETIAMILAYSMLLSSLLSSKIRFLMVA